MTRHVKSTLCGAGLVALTLALQTGAGQASVVNHGFLSSDDATSVIVDSANNRQYTRLNAFDLSVAQTEAAIGVGGAYEGWSVVTSAIMDQFIAAALGLASTACDGAVAYGQTCGTITGWADGHFGAGFESTYDYIGYYNTNVGNPIGLLEIRASGQVKEYESWSDAGGIDYYSAANGYPINLMLYKDIAAVPVPAAGLMLMAGLGGLGALRRRKACMA
jgi:hypothetical protein